MLKKVLPLAIVLGVILLTVSMEYPAQPDIYSDPTSIEEAYAPVVVLELFTSQGCSSCPAADHLLNEVRLSADDRVIPLSYHVDYWNYIGWADPFSSPDFTRKQSLYNAKFKNRGNYTPQLVINGKEHIVGSDKARLRTKIAAFKNLKVPNKINLSDIQKIGSKVHFNFQVAGDILNRRIRALLVLDERTTVVKRGENRNRKLVNGNIVLLEKSAGLHSDSGSMMIEVPKSVGIKEPLHLVVLVENDNYDITAGANIAL